MGVAAHHARPRRGRGGGRPGRRHVRRADRRGGRRATSCSSGPRTRTRRPPELGAAGRPARPRPADHPGRRRRRPAGPPGVRSTRAAARLEVCATDRAAPARGAPGPAACCHRAEERPASHCAAQLPATRGRSVTAQPRAESWSRLPVYQAVARWSRLRGRPSQAVDGVEPAAARGRDARHRRRVRLRQVDARPDARRARARRTRGTLAYRGTRRHRSAGSAIAAAARRAVQMIFQDPVRVARPAHDRAGHRR